MRKIFLENLKRHEDGANKGKIDWKRNIGSKCRFTYDEIDGEVEITSIDNKYIYFTYNDKQFKKASGHFKNCEFANVVGKILMEHRYEVGEIINGCMILNKTNTLRNSGGNVRTYSVKCVKCGYIADDKLESTLLKGGGCGVCSKHISTIVKGINDIATTHPHLVKYFANIDDSTKITFASNKKVLMKCPDCGTEKYCTPNYLSASSFPCKMCGDGVSYPEKIMFNMLGQLEIDFISEYSPSWAGRSRYDFYIPSKNLIIEMDGAFHYIDNDMSNTTKEEAMNLDNRKELLANKHGINVIRVDSRTSRIEYIKSKIKESEVIHTLDKTEDSIDWIECHRFACSSRVKEACDLWNSGIRSTNQIGDIMKVYQSTTCNYLKKGSMCGMCDYDPVVAKSEAARNTCLNRVYTKKEKGVPKIVIQEAIKENKLRDVCKDFSNGMDRIDIASKYNLDVNTIRKYIKKGKHVGLCDYNYEDDNCKHLKEVQKANKKPVEVYKDGKLIGCYDSASDISDISIAVFGERLDFRNISAVCKGKRKTYKGYVFKFK